ncbi:ABC transporter permease [Cohnella sp. GCM10012308]|uniref:ABC transporter permease n=1 Tax=Cohnella sp. GCM10012308 TaxID=3317329 RepID=UPI00361AF77F
MIKSNSLSAPSVSGTIAGRAVRPSRRKLAKYWQLYALALPAVVYFAVFCYVPMYGVQIAFKDYTVTGGIWGSPWVGLTHFERFFNSYYFSTLISNTLLISLLQLLMFPIAIIVALSINELKNGFYKKFVQTVTYIPHFISVVVLCGMLISFLNPSTGILNRLIVAAGGHALPFLTDPSWFKPVYVLSGEWQNLGWGAIVYLAALAGVNPDLHEAATIDGASRWQRIIHINLPAIKPTIVILFILSTGNLMNIGFEKVYLLQNELNREGSDIIQTYVYRTGLLGGQYSFSAAVGLFNSGINLFVLVFVNTLARRISRTSLW